MSPAQQGIVGQVEQLGLSNSPLTFTLPFYLKGDIFT